MGVKRLDCVHPVSPRSPEDMPLEMSLTRGHPYLGTSSAQRPS